MDLNELFGPDAEAETQGENGQESAEPADNTETEVNEAMEDGGEQEAVGGGTKETVARTEGEHDGASKDGNEGKEAGKEKQSKADNAAFAAARRKAEKERDMEVAKAKQDADRVIRDFLKNASVTDPYTGKIIETREEYEAYMARMGEEQKKSFVEKSGVSEAEFDAFINSLPQVREARRAAEKAREESTRAHMTAQIQEIHAIDKTVGSMEDLTKMDTYPQFYEYVKRGASFVEAYKLANYDRLMAAAQSRTRQQAYNAAAGKDHLAKTSTRGSGAADVPADVAKEYRNLMPDATDADIRRHYQRYMNKN